MGNTMRRVRRSTGLASAAAVVAVAAAACSSGSSGGGGGGGGGVQDLTLWARADDAGFLPGLVKEFNNQHKKIQLKLTLVPDAQVVQKYSTAASSGSGPDIVAVEIGTIPQFTSTGWLQDITSDVDKLPYKSALSPAHLKQGAVGDKNYAVPFTADVSVLYWNKTLFQKAGLNPDKGPSTWAEIVADAKKVRALGGDNYGYFFSGNCGGCMGFTMLPYMWANGGDVLQNSGDTVTPTLSPNPQLKATLNFYRTMWNDGLVPRTAKTENGSNQFGQFFSGKIGMFVQGTYPFAVLKKEHPNIKFGVTNVPSTDGSSSASFAGGDDMAITKNTDHATGMTVLKWFLQQGQQSLAQSGVLPVRSDLAAAYEKKDPRNKVFVKALQVGHTPKAAKVSAVFFDANGPFVALIQSAVFGTGSIDADMAKAQTSAASLLSK